MNKLDNLKSWEKGQSGNPRGRPKGSLNISRLTRDILEDEAIYTKLLNLNLISKSRELPSKTCAEALIYAVTIKALNGDIKAAELVRKFAYEDKTGLDRPDYPIALVEFV